MKAATAAGRFPHEAIRRVWLKERDAIAQTRRAAERQAADLRAQIDQLHRRALLGDEAFDADTVRRLREDLLQHRLTVAEAALGDATCDGLDVEAILGFAAYVLENAGRLWEEAPPVHRLQLGRVLFPQGVVFDGLRLHTPVSAFSGNDLQGMQGGVPSLVD